LVHFKNRKELETWLQKQPRAVSVALAARAALRALPVMQKALLRGDYRSGLVLPVFRATAVSWAAAKYPAHEKELASAAHPAHAAAGDATYADVRAAATAADAAAYAAHSVNDPANANANASRAATAAANAYVYYANDAEEAFDALWSTISTDATFRERGRTASKIAGLPLWPNNQPDDLESSWQEMKNVLHGANEDWQVWTTWYDDRLAGRVQEEERELAYVRIDDNLWLEGPGIVNAEIKRRIEELEPSPPLIEAIPEQVSFVEELIGVVVKAPAPVPKNPPTLPVPIEKVPSALSFGWSSKGTISVVSGTLNWPVSPFQGGERDHANRLEACRALAADTARSLRSGKWNARSDYAETLDQYLAYLPVQPEEGNFLLADAEVRIIRSMFAAEQDFMPVPLAAKLKVLLEQHIGLRAYYPATEDFYESVRSGHLERPLPMDAVEGFIQGVRDNTPTLFEPNVPQSLEGVAQPIPTISNADDEAPKADSAQPAPPPDPLGEVDPEKSRRFTLGSAVNALWKAVLSGEKAGKTVEGWSTVIATLGPNVVPILEWLRSVL
jgi:hypothetical protein